jgi:hypothetical protein
LEDGLSRSNEIVCWPLMSEVGQKAEKLRLSTCLLLFPQQRTFIKATAANSTRIDAARNKPPHPELIDKFADWLIARGLFVLNSNFLRMNQSHRSTSLSRQRFNRPPPLAMTALTIGH